MKKLFKKPGWYRVGISIDDTLLRYVILERDIVKEENQICAENVALALKKLYQEIKDLPCNFALSSSQGAVKTLSMSEYLNPKEIYELLIHNSELYFGANTQSVTFDFEFINAAKQKVRVIASRKEVVKKWQEAFARAQLELKIISLDALAVESYLRAGNVLEDEKTYAAFLVHGSDLLQMIITAGKVQFLNTQVMTIPCAPFFEQEAAKFLAAYQTSTSGSHPVNEFILLGVDDEKHAVFLDYFSKPIHEETGGEYLLPLGMALAC